MTWNAVRGSLHIAGAVILALVIAGNATAKKKASSTDEGQITEAELQAELMSFADRFASINAQAIDDLASTDSSLEARGAIKGDLVFAMAAAYTVAADPDPQLALLDLMVMARLGRMVFEDYWRPRYPQATEPAVTAYRQLEGDAWKLATPILSEAQQQELGEAIALYHESHPEISTFSHLRFGDLPSRRTTSTLRKQKSGGMFQSVRRVTEQVEQTRLLAERSVFLATRLPLLTGFFADLWLSQLSSNPAVAQSLADVHAFSEVAERLAAVVEELPDQIAQERHSTVEQIVREASALRSETLQEFAGALARERRDTIEQFLAEEDRLGGLLTALRGTLEEGNNLLVSVNHLTETLGLGADSEPEEPTKPFDIAEYRDTLVQLTGVIREMNTLVGSTDTLVASPALVSMVDAAGTTGQRLIDRVFWAAVLWVIVVFACYVAAKLLYQGLAARLFRERSA